MAPMPGCYQKSTPHFGYSSSVPQGKTCMGYGSATVSCDNYFSGVLYPISRGCLRACGVLTDRAAIA